MLQNIRDNAQSTIAKGIVLLMIIPFVFFGIDSFFAGGGEKTVAEINGTEITERELLRGIAIQKENLRAQLGDAYDPNLISDASLKPRVLESLVQRQLYKDAANELGLVASDRLLDEQIVSRPEFQEAGQFSSERYEGLLRANGMLPGEHRSQLRTQITANHLLSGLAGSAFATNRDVATLAMVTDERRDIRYITVPAADPEAMNPVSDDDIAAYYQENQQRFMQQESIRLNYLELKLSDFFSAVSEEDILATYEREKAAYEPDSEWELAHILIATTEAERDLEQAQKRAQEVLQKLADGLEFSELAAEYSDDPGSADNGGRLGVVESGVFPEFDPALQRLQVGEFSQPVESPSGVHILKLLGVEQTEYPSLEESRDRIARELQAATATPEYVTAIEDLANATFGSDDLSLAAEEFNLPLQTTEFFTRSEGTGIASFPAVRERAFSDEFLSEGHSSSEVELGDDRVVIMRLNEFREAEPKSLITVAEQIRAEIEQQRLDSLSEEKAEQVLAVVQEKRSVEAAADETKLEWQVQLQAARNNITLPRPVVDAAFAQDSFAANNGTAYAIARLVNGDRAVIEVSNVQAGNINRVPGEEQRMLQANLAQLNGNRSFESFFQSLRNSANIAIID